MAEKQKFRILAVDDDPDIRFLYETALTDHFEIFTANNGLDALVKLPRVQPDLVIADLMMPLMDGWELLKRLRADGENGETPVILVSALNQQEDMRKGYQYGATVYLTKPFDVARLRRNVTVSLEGREPKNKNSSDAVLKQQFEALNGGTAEPLPELPAETPAPKAPAAAPAPPPPAATFTTMPPPAPAAAAEAPSPGSDSSHRHAPPPAPAPESGSSSRRMVLPHGRMPIPTQGRETIKPRVLIVEPDAEEAERLRKIIEQHYEAVIAKDGQDATDLIPLVQPDIYLIEAALPKVNGYKLAENVRKTYGTQEAPIVFTSEKDILKEKTALAHRGIRHLIQKPIRPTELLHVIRAVCDSPGFQAQKKEIPIADLLRQIGRFRAEIAQKHINKVSPETVNKMQHFIRDNIQKKPGEH